MGLLLSWYDEKKAEDEEEEEERPVAGLPAVSSLPVVQRFPSNHGAVASARWPHLSDWRTTWFGQIASESDMPIIKQWLNETIQQYGAGVVTVVGPPQTGTSTMARFLRSQLSAAEPLALTNDLFLQRYGGRPLALCSLHTPNMLYKRRHVWAIQGTPRQVREFINSALHEVPTLSDDIRSTLQHIRDMYNDRLLESPWSLVVPRFQFILLVFGLNGSLNVKMVIDARKCGFPIPLPNV